MAALTSCSSAPELPQLKVDMLGRLRFNRVRLLVTRWSLTTITRMTQSLKRKTSLPSSRKAVSSRKQPINR